MPNEAPSPTDEVERFLRCLIKSRLHDADRIRAYINEVPSELRKNLDALIERMVTDVLLTHFQASKLKQGTFQGLVLGPYHILSPLGKGGMGAVYLARDTRKLGKKQPGHTDPALVALKVLPPKRARQDERTLARFQREKELAEQVSHPHLTKTFESGDIDGVHYIAMEYIRGDSLRHLISNHGPLLVSRAARIFTEVADGLQHAHERGLIHRDLKPSNIMITPNGHAKILDLGLAIRLDEELPLDKTIVGGEGYVVGTMDYIAPEQIENPTSVDGRADLYSLGCSIYFALTGQTPFPGGTSKEKMKKHRKEFADPITDFNPTVPAEFCRIVERLMAKSPTHRFNSAAKVKEALANWIADDPPTPLDVDPDQTEAEVIKELERTQGSNRTVLETIPLMVFTEKADKYSRRKKAPSTASIEVPAETPEAPIEDPIPEDSEGMPIWWIPALILGGFLLITILITVAMMIKG